MKSESTNQTQSDTLAHVEELATKLDHYFSEYEQTDRSIREQEVLTFWETHHIFEKTLEKESIQGEFVFYEGPPTANGRPGLHHMESRTFKDVIPRFKTMQGYHVRRKGGWDTHGLPVELEVEKQLGLTSKTQVEEYGIGPFNEKCKESVWKYVNEWEAYTKRIGYWVDLENPYITYYPSYIESLWNIVGKIDDQGLLEEDYKVVPWCPRCQTGLSSHELAQGYKTVKDLSVTAQFKVVGEENTYILAWTTTPWTLPGNVALAVGEEINYVYVNVEGVTVVCAFDRLEELFAGKTFEVVKQVKGSDLVGMQYEPLYPFLKEKLESEGQNIEKAYKVYAADFVDTTTGTGVVHTAVMYGQDDFELGHGLGLPKMHTVQSDGHFEDWVGEFGGRFVKDEEVAIDIIKDLAHRGLLFSKEKYEHTYPFCWRCKTPLVYYARGSWYVRMSKKRDELLAANNDINWEPSHIKEGRFGEWLREVKDWAISRERYWGTPLPVWKTESGKRVVVDSLKRLKTLTKRSGNKYYAMRHGQAESNLGHIVCSTVNAVDPLTELGEQQVTDSAERLKELGIQKIVCSPFYRTRETAKITAEVLGLTENDIVYDMRIAERSEPSYEGKPWKLVTDEVFAQEDWFHHNAGGDGESYEDLRKRMMEAMFEYENTYQDTKILFVSHRSPIDILSIAIDWQDSKTLPSRYMDQPMMDNAEIRFLDFVPYPRDSEFKLDLHRPFIDEVDVWFEGEKLTRVPEVMDVWFDSGAMPYAQDHYPFENNDLIDRGGVPASYISEAVDQTRGWFYTLLAVGVLMGVGTPYRNVICLGHIMAADGSKMSKSRGNAVNPWEAMAQYGADVIRLWMTTVNQPGDSKNFDPKTITDVQRRTFGLLDNVVKFYQLSLAEDSQEDLPNPSDSKHVLDVWILALTDQLVRNVTNALESYDLFTAGRAVRSYILDLSQWYIRRSRERMKGDGEDAKMALAVTRHVLMQYAKVLAPFAPFAAEEVYQVVKLENDPESIHLAAWPEMHVEQTEVIDAMKAVRDVVSEGLQKRSEAKMKVRQPLQSVTVQSVIADEYVPLVLAELNVKEVLVNENQEESVILDVNLTEELLHEGMARELVRQVQSMRKKAGLVVEDRIELFIEEVDEVAIIVDLAKADLESVAGVVNLQMVTVGDAKIHESLKLSSDLHVGLGVHKTS